ncbi:MAG: pantetheine-phosphate adenylyltransferase [Prevotella sp.]|nr:pantetheine-phosphate adenylyltransferase [Prevotella sp.]MBR7086198.1 pantetheine-phosphate adenylyltransferase [Prevotella sp.]
MRKGLFVGTFDPFTIGHESIVSRALGLFDVLVIGVGVNPAKKPLHTPEERVEAIEQLYADEPRIDVVAYEGLTVDLARECEAQYIVKGVRSVHDFEFEREQADINRRLSGIETILLPAEPGLESISSTLLRELQTHGHDISEFLPSSNQ